MTRASERKADTGIDYIITEPGYLPWLDDPTRPSSVDKDTIDKMHKRELETLKRCQLSVQQKNKK